MTRTTATAIGSILLSTLTGACVHPAGNDPSLAPRVLPNGNGGNFAVWVPAHAQVVAYGIERQADGWHLAFIGATDSSATTRLMTFQDGSSPVALPAIRHQPSPSARELRVCGRGLPVAQTDSTSVYSYHWGCTTFPAAGFAVRGPSDARPDGQTVEHVVVFASSTFRAPESWSALADSLGASATFAAASTKLERTAFVQDPGARWSAVVADVWW